jgi:hypothetical protein
VKLDVEIFVMQIAGQNRTWYSIIAGYFAVAIVKFVKKGLTRPALAATAEVGSCAATCESMHRIVYIQEIES